MKFPLHLILAASAPAPSLAYLPSLPNSHRSIAAHQSSTTRLHYQPGERGSSDKNSGETDSSNVWTVLANTERWISDTLDKSNTAANDRNAKLREEEKKSKMHFADEKEKQQQSSSAQPQDNPYARKEVSYVCETGDELSLVVGGIFRRVREARELGESHGKSAHLRVGEYVKAFLFCCLLSYCCDFVYLCVCHLNSFTSSF